MKLSVASTAYTDEERCTQSVAGLVKEMKVEREILASIDRRLMAGHRQYGAFTRAPDGRVMVKEALEEVEMFPR